MIQEFKAFPELDWRQGAKDWTWPGKIAVDLRFVATVRPGMAPGGTTITMMGNPMQFEVQADYYALLEQWLKASIKL